MRHGPRRPRGVGAGLALAVSGIAGPDGGTPDKPVGTVWIATARAGSAAGCHRLPVLGDRDAVRRKAAVAGLLAAACAAACRPFLDTPVAW